MVRRYFSTEDTNLTTATLTGGRNQDYADINLLFEKKPSGDVYKKTAGEAVKQAVKNLLLTNIGEKPFSPYFGGGLHNYLFELGNESTALEIENQVKFAIENWEPRAIVRDVQISFTPDANDLRVRVEFKVTNIEEVITLETTVQRLR